MRRAIALAAVVFLVACGGKDSPAEPPPPTGTVRFTLDAQSCANSSWTLQFFVDGGLVGTLPTPPGASHEFDAEPGFRRLSARIVPDNLDWPTTNRLVTANATTVYILTCVA